MAKHKAIIRGGGGVTRAMETVNVGRFGLGYFGLGCFGLGCFGLGCFGWAFFQGRMFRPISYIPVKSTDFGGSLPIFLPFLPCYCQPTDLPQSTDFYRFFSLIYRIIIFCTDLFVILCKLCSHKCYFHVLMVKSVNNFLYLNVQATCNVLAQWVKCR